LFERRRTYQRTIYRPGELLQFDLWEPRGEIPVGHGQTRRAWVVTAELGWSRAIAGALVFSKEFDDIAFGMTRCLTRLGALPETAVWDREGAIHAGGGQPSDAFAGFCGQLRVGWLILEARDPQAKGALERSHRFMRTNFEPGRGFANELDYQHQLDSWCDRVNQRVHRTTRAVVAERLAVEREQMRPLPERMPRLIGGSSYASRRSPICALTPTTTRWTRGWSVAVSRSRSRSARDGGRAGQRRLACRHRRPFRAASDLHRPRQSGRAGQSCAANAGAAARSTSSCGRWLAMTP
jgi:hypothetical protein